MQALVETTEGLNKRVTITLLPDEIEKAIENEILKRAKTAKIDGFRRGKVPIQLIKQRYSESITQDILTHFMQDHFAKTIVQENLNLASKPQYLTGQYKKDENYTYSVEFEVYPDIKLKDLELIEVEKPIVEISDHDVDQMLEKLRQQKKIWQEVDLPAQLGDRVTFNFNGSIDGKTFEGSSGRDFVLELGEGKMIPGFEEGIVGHKTEEEFTISVTFPEEYDSESLRGKESQFLIQLNKIEKSHLPELNEEFIKGFHLSGEPSLETLRAEISKNMRRELKKTLREKIKEQTIKGLCDLNKIQVPLSLIESEIDDLKAKAESYLDKQNITKELPRSLFFEKAQNRVRVGLLLSEVISENQLNIDENKIQIFLEEMAAAYETPKKMIEYYQNNQKLMSNIRDLVLEEEAIQFLLKNAKVTEKEMSFSEFIDGLNTDDAAN